MIRGSYCDRSCRYLYKYKNIAHLSVVRILCKNKKVYREQIMGR